jgi:hypothetical protein
VIERLGDIYREGRPTPAPRPNGDRPRAVARPASAVPPEPIPTSPPAEVLDALDTAARVLEELDSAQLSLHFEVRDGEAGKRIHVEVLASDGSLVREIPARNLMDVLAGTGRGLTVDERG